VQHTVDALLAKGYPKELGDFILGVTGCSKRVPPANT
jgi:hypothetical protein